MKKVIIFSYILLFISTFFFYTKDVFAVSCRQNGNTTYCDDGTTYRQNGDMVYGNDGTTYRQNGNTTYGSDGTTFRQNGNISYGSNGVSCTQNGNKMFCSDGSSYFTNGNTTYGTGGNVFNSCPANSSYDSSSGKCQCQDGYKVDGSSCVYDYSYNAQPTYKNTVQTNSPSDITTPQPTTTIDSGSDSSSSGWVIVIGLGAGILVVKYLVSFYGKAKTD